MNSVELAGLPAPCPLPRRFISTLYPFHPFPTRGGKTPSRILPVEGDQLRAVGPQPRSESTGGATMSPGGDPPRRRGQIRESGDVGGRGTPGRELELVVVKSGKLLPHPDEGRTEFTTVMTVLIVSACPVNKLYACVRYWNLRRTERTINMLDRYKFCIATCAPIQRHEWLMTLLSDVAPDHPMQQRGELCF